MSTTVPTGAPEQWFLGWNSLTMHLPNEQMLAQCVLPAALPLDGPGMDMQQIDEHPRVSACRACRRWFA